MTGDEAIALAVVALLLATRGPSAWEATAAEQAARVGAPAPVLLAIIDAENPAWDPRAVNRRGGDGERGGSWGLPQITLQTAREVDDRRSTDWREIDADRGGRALLDHPEIALRLAALHVAALAAEYADPSDVAAAYNAGVPLRRAPASTHDYVRRFERALARRTR